MSKYGHEIVSRRVIWVVYVWNNDMFLMMVIERRKIKNKIYVLLIYICVYSEMKEWFSIFDIKREFLINCLIFELLFDETETWTFLGFPGGWLRLPARTLISRILLATRRASRGWTARLKQGFSLEYIITEKGCGPHSCLDFLNFTYVSKFCHRETWK